MYVRDVVFNKFEPLVDSSTIWVSNLRVNISCTDVSALISRIFSKGVTQRKLACIFANYGHCIFQAPRINFLRLQNNAFGSIRNIIAILFEYVTLSDVSISRIAVKSLQKQSQFFKVLCNILSQLNCSISITNSSRLHAEKEKLLDQVNIWSYRMKLRPRKRRYKLLYLKVRYSTESMFLVKIQWDMRNFIPTPKRANHTERYNWKFPAVNFDHVNNWLRYCLAQISNQ